MLLALIQTSLKNEASQGSTLIVSPLSLLLQWQEEIESKTNLTYRTYYGDNRQGEDFNVDVVLTTYGSLQSEWLTFSKAPEGSGSSVLLGHEWKRVILDEAHYVKNTSTVASKACRMLRAERRWCVSGTIIQNSLDDVYALLAFLRHEPWCHKSFWKAAISTKLRSAESSPDDKQEGLDRVRRLLAPIMLRRTKTSLDQDG
jgi:DNA repair protein RAD5